MDIVVFDSYIVDDGHFSQGILMFNITTPPFGHPFLKRRGVVPRRSGLLRPETFFTRLFFVFF
ncbi:MAG: hypothetical protein J6T87_04785 [Bacteroidales bacterium]|nr:hypothetical protein [Bacteroidales bacterium]